MEKRECDSRLKEVIRFVITGGICFLVEFLVLVLLKELAGMDTLIATPIAFTISVIVNYLICVAWVFQKASASGNSTKIGFFLTSLAGLLLNEGFMLLFRYVFGEDTVLVTVFGFTVTMYMLNKVISTLLVMIWNYFTKRAMLTQKSMKE